MSTHPAPVVVAVDGTDRSADLLLLAKHPSGLAHVGLLGATARALLQHATCPVMVLPVRRAAVLGLELEASGRPLR